jgi:divalent metal cation (Fe/Co/Zn/Cd) transporter
LSVEEGYNIATAVEEKVQAVANAYNVTAHIDPVNRIEKENTFNTPS